MTHAERLYRLETDTATMSRALHLVTSRLTWLIGEVLEVLPDERYEELWRHDVLTALDDAHSTDERVSEPARQTLKQVGLLVPDAPPAEWE